MGGIIVIRGKITVEHAKEAEETYPETSNHLTLTAPYGASAKSIGKAVALLESKQQAYYSELETALAGFDWNQ